MWLSRVTRASRKTIQINCGDLLIGICLFQPALSATLADEKIYLIRRPTITWPPATTPHHGNNGAFSWQWNVYSVSRNHRRRIGATIGKAAIQINESQLAKRHYLSNRFDSSNIDDLNWTVWTQIDWYVGALLDSELLHGSFSTLFTCFTNWFVSRAERGEFPTET